jgi:predicted nucleic acid-binding protein
MKKYVLDSNALLCFFQKEKSWEIVSNIFKEYLSGKIELSMSVLNYGEFLYIVKTRTDEIKYNQIKSQFDMLGVELVDIDLEQVNEAVEYKSQGGIAYPDTFVLALAKKNGSTIVTGDKEFKKFEKEFKIEWL